jgi:3',5'-cyclic AMP phosphodiesterase CpdA
MSQLEFIKNKIEANQDDRFVILLHHNLLPCSSGTQSETFWYRALNAVLRDKDLVVHGHSHVYGDYKLPNGTQVLVASMANEILKIFVGFNATIRDDANEFVYCELNDVIAHRMLLFSEAKAAAIHSSSVVVSLILF